MALDLTRFANTIITEMADAVIYADAEGAIRFWNKAATRIFGFSEAEALGQTLDIIIPENLRQRHWTGFDETLRTGKTRYRADDVLAVPALNRDGARISIEFTILPFQDSEGHMVGIAAVLRDVTERFEETKAMRKKLALLEGGNSV